MSKVEYIFTVVGKASCVVTQPTDGGMEPWMLALIIVVSVVLTLAIIFAAVCIVNYCRKKKLKEKGSGTVKGSIPIMTSQLSERSSDGGHDNLPDRDILASEQRHM